MPWTGVLAAGKPDGAWPVPPGGRRAAPPIRWQSALAWSWSAEAALADRGGLVARGWLSVPAGCLFGGPPGGGTGPLSRGTLPGDPVLRSHGTLA